MRAGSKGRIGRLKGGLHFQEGYTPPGVDWFPSISCGVKIKRPHSSSLCERGADPQHFGFARGNAP